MKDLDVGVLRQALKSIESALLIHSGPTPISLIGYAQDTAERSREAIRTMKEAITVLEPYVREAPCGLGARLKDGPVGPGGGKITLPPPAPVPPEPERTLLDDLLEVCENIEGLTECNCGGACEGTCTHSMAKVLVLKAEDTGLDAADLPALLDVCADAVGLTGCNCPDGPCLGTCTHSMAQAALAKADGSEPAQPPSLPNSTH
jgi:hypothetical protein